MLILLHVTTALIQRRSCRLSGITAQSAAICPRRRPHRRCRHLRCSLLRCRHRCRLHCRRHRRRRPCSHLRPRHHLRREHASRRRLMGSGMRTISRAIPGKTLIASIPTFLRGTLTAIIRRRRSRPFVTTAHCAASCHHHHPRLHRRRDYHRPCHHCLQPSHSLPCCRRHFHRERASMRPLRLRSQMRSATRAIHGKALIASIPIFLHATPTPTQTSSCRPFGTTALFAAICHFPRPRRRCRQLRPHCHRHRHQYRRRPHRPHR